MSIKYVDPKKHEFEIGKIGSFKGFRYEKAIFRCFEEEGRI